MVSLAAGQKREKESFFLVMRTFRICISFLKRILSTYLFGHAAWLVGSQFPNLGLNPCPWQ